MSKIVATAILSSTLTEKLIVSIKGRGAKLDADIHQAGLSAMDHHAKHGDTTLVNRLILAMPKSSRRNALVAWMLAFNTKLVMNTDKGSKAEQVLVHNKEGVGFAQADADATPFWEFKAVEGTPVFSFDTYLTSLTKGLDRAMAQPLTDEQKAKLQAAKAALIAQVSTEGVGLATAVAE